MEERDLHSGPPMPTRKDFRIGIIGAGFIVNECHLPAYRKAGLNPVAIASRTAARAAEVASRQGIPEACESITQLLDDTTIEVLDLAVPPNAQLALIRAACARKTVKAILAQNPLGLNYAEALESVEACEAAGITLAVNQSMRFDPSVRAAKRLLTRGELGDAILATIDMRGVLDARPWHAELGWSTLRGISIHHLDCFRHWFGNPARIFCSVRPANAESPQRGGIATYILEYDSGLRCIGIDDTSPARAGAGSPPAFQLKWRVEGSNGLALGEIGWVKTPFNMPSSIQFALKGDRGFRTPALNGSWYPDAFAGTMGELLLALETDTSPVLNGRENLATVALVDAALRSVEKQRAVSPDEITGPAKKPAPATARSTESRQSETVVLPRREAVRAATPQTLETESIELVPEKPAAPFETRQVRREVTPATTFTRASRTALVPSDRKSRLPAVVQTSRRQRARTGLTSHLSRKVMQAVEYATFACDQFNHSAIGTEHLLLGVAEQGSGPVGDVMREVGLTVSLLERAVEDEVGRGDPFQRINTPALTSLARKTLQLAIEEAEKSGAIIAGPEHLLLAMARHGEGVGARILDQFGVTADKVEDAIGITERA